METCSAWMKYDASDEERLEDLASKYRRFISECKTERECVSRAIADAEAKGYVSLEDMVAAEGTLRPGRQGVGHFAREGPRADARRQGPL